MLEPLKQFVCDYCGEIIDSPREGWIEWITEYGDDGRRYAYGFKIVHHAVYSPRRPKDCYHYTDSEGRSDMHLGHVMNMGYLLHFLDVGPYHEPEYLGPSVRDVREFVEIMRRLTTPYYEEARLYWEKALADGFFSGASPVWIYQPETLKSLIELYGA